MRMCIMCKCQTKEILIATLGLFFALFTIFLPYHTIHSFKSIQMYCAFILNSLYYMHDKTKAKRIASCCSAVIRMLILTSPEISGNLHCDRVELPPRPPALGPFTQYILVSSKEMSPCG